MTDLFLFARLNIPNVLISIARKIFHIDFPSPCLMYQKRQISLPVGYKNRWLGTTETSFQDSKPREKQISPTFSYFLINNALLYHFLADLLAHNKKMTEKSVFCEAWSPEMTSQSFPVSCFWSHCFVPYRKWNLTLLVHQNTGKENRYRNLFLAILISTLGRFNRANKKICHIHFKRLSQQNRQTRSKEKAQRKSTFRWRQNIGNDKWNESVRQTAVLSPE